MDTYLIQCGPRVKKVIVSLADNYENPIKAVLEKAIRNMMKNDAFMRDSADAGFFMTYLDPQSNHRVEIDDTTKPYELDASSPIEIMLHDSISLGIPVRQSNSDTSAVAAVPTHVTNYMDKLGLTIHRDFPSSGSQRPEPSAPTSQVSKQSLKSSESGATGKTQSSKSASRSKRKQATSSDEEVEYLNNMLRQKEANRAAAERAVPKEASKLAPPKKRKKNNSDKENIPPRVMPRRAAKDKPHTDVDLIEDDEDDEEVPTVEGVSGPLAIQPLKVVQLKTVGHFHKLKNYNQIGTLITKFTPLPPFPQKLRTSLEKGVYDTHMMNAFLKEHIEEHKKRPDAPPNTSLKKTEYKELAEKVVNRLKSMNFENADSYMTKIKTDLSTCLRSARYYPKKRENRKRCGHDGGNGSGEAGGSSGSGQAGESSGPSQAGGSSGPGQADGGSSAGQRAADVSAGQGTVVTDEADVILRRPVQNKNSVKLCIKKSTKRIQFIKKHTVEEVLSTYPYLREPDLLVYEYSCRVPLLLTNLETNFLESIGPLSHILDEPLPEIDDQLSKVKLFHGIENFYSGGRDHLPSIQFCDATNSTAAPLNEVPYGQAPALVIAQDENMIYSASLIFDGSILTSMRTPSAFDCVALLMAAYWVFHINFPPAYMQHMETIEALLHGRMKQKARSVSRFPKMDEFFRKFINEVESR